MHRVRSRSRGGGGGGEFVKQVGSETGEGLFEDGDAAFELFVLDCESEDLPVSVGKRIWVRFGAVACACGEGLGYTRRRFNFGLFPPARSLLSPLDARLAWQLAIAFDLRWSGESTVNHFWSSV